MFMYLQHTYSQIAAWRYSKTCISLKGRERFSWGRRSHSYRCELLSLIIATCIETIADAEQQLNKLSSNCRIIQVAVRSGTFAIQLTILGAR